MRLALAGQPLARQRDQLKCNPGAMAAQRPERAAVLSPQSTIQQVAPSRPDQLILDDHRHTRVKRPPRIDRHDHYVGSSELRGVTCWRSGEINRAPTGALRKGTRREKHEGEMFHLASLRSGNQLDFQTSRSVLSSGDRNRSGAKRRPQFRSAAISAPWGKRLGHLRSRLLPPAPAKLGARPKAANSRAEEQSGAIHEGLPAAPISCWRLRALCR
jgi:hypothetical protein